MIKICRCPIPKGLSNPSLKNDLYNRKDVVLALWEMQKHKCCYCESKIPSEGHQKAVEHFKPKAIFKNLKNDWENLLLACPQCNGKKSNLFPIILSDDINNIKVIYLKSPISKNPPAIIDPSNPTINPEDHIGFDFFKNDYDSDFGIIKANGSLGAMTIEIIGLDRKYYTQRRFSYYLDTISYVYLLLLKAKHQNSNLDAIKYHFTLLMASESEFAAFSRSFARYKKLDEIFGLEIP